MFERAWHRDVLRILGGLNAELLVQNRFLFGGGTRLVLELKEFRESLDIDFLCSDASGYGELRSLARSGGYPALFSASEDACLTFPRQMRIDQYGIRFPVACNGTTIKVELIREGRVQLGSGTRPSWSPVDCLYKAAVANDLRKALALFTEDLNFQSRCFQGLRIRDRSRILRGISSVATDLDSWQALRT